ncbi:MAG: hypothetical protein IJM99_09230 [Firmicutes bacterium]|nr:hypothetical protein [Bacillota bacterium]
MPNTFLTPEVIAREALMVLRNNAIMAKLVHRDYSDEFVGAVGDTITIRKPATFTAEEFEGNIKVQDATETGVSVVMDKHLDVSFAVSSKQMALSIEDFSKQLLVPAMQAFADKVDKYLLSLEAEVTGRVPHDAGAIAPEDIIAARKILTQNAVPATDRHMVIGAVADADLLTSELFTSANQVGDEGTALREASLGRKYGFDIYTDQNVGSVEGTVGYTPSLAFHRNAFALVTRQLEMPMGASKAATINYDGFGLRVVYAYDINTKTDTISIDMLCGVKMLDDKLAAVIVDSRA